RHGRSLHSLPQTNMSRGEADRVLGDEIRRRCVAESEADTLFMQLLLADWTLPRSVQQAPQLGLDGQTGLELLAGRHLHLASVQYSIGVLRSRLAERIRSYGCVRIVRQHPKFTQESGNRTPS